MNKFPMTKNGFIELQKKLNKLKTFNRPNIVKAIKTAREHGDIKENSEYHAAKEEQHLIEIKIKEIENKILHSSIVDINKTKDSKKITFGTTVYLKNTGVNENMIYQIVGEDEASIIKNKISIKSPMAKALILKIKDDFVKINTLNKVLKYQVMNIKYIQL